METKEIKFTIKRFGNQEELPDDEKRLLAAARKVASGAYSPYSKFSVGAAVLLENGEIILGNNQENASFPAGVCAEHVALAFANANWPDVAVTAIAISAISADQAASVTIRPCGVCRQVMVEIEKRFSRPIKVIMDGKSGIDVVDQASHLLPLSFNL